MGIFVLLDEVSVVWGGYVALLRMVFHFGNGVCQPSLRHHRAEIVAYEVFVIVPIEQQG